jgi:hypothetical protein
LGAHSLPKQMCSQVFSFGSTLPSEICLVFFILLIWAYGKASHPLEEGLELIKALILLPFSFLISLITY